jgi:hypothetical protein
MAMEYLIVYFPEQRRVMIDHADSGFDTNVVIETDGGHHTISLDNPLDYTPEAQEIVLEGTNVLAPEEVTFEKK